MSWCMGKCIKVQISYFLAWWTPMIPQIFWKALLSVCKAP